MRNLKRIFIASVIGFVILNLISFLMLFIPYYVLELDRATLEIIEYIRIFVTKLIEFVIPASAGIILYFISRNGRTWVTVVRGIYLALPRFIYLIPYYYLYYISFGYDSIESITMSIAVSIFGVILVCAQMLVIYLGMRLAASLTVKKAILNSMPPLKRKLSSESEKMHLKTKIRERLPLENDIGSPLSAVSPLDVGILGAVLTQFIFSFIYEMVDTIEYLVEYAGYYTNDEIIYLFVCYLFLAVELIICQLICHAMCRYISKDYREVVKDEGNA